MKYIKQIIIILLISALGEVLHILLPFPVPASVYGLVIMLTALISGIIKLHQVEATADFLVDIMPVMFISGGVGLINTWGILQDILVPVIVITLVSTIVVLIVSGHVTQYVIRMQRRREKK